MNNKDNRSPKQIAYYTGVWEGKKSAYRECFRHLRARIVQLRTSQHYIDDDSDGEIEGLLSAIEVLQEKGPSV